MGLLVTFLHRFARQICSNELHIRQQCDVKNVRRSHNSELEQLYSWPRIEDVTLVAIGGLDVQSGSRHFLDHSNLHDLLADRKLVCGKLNTACRLLRRSFGDLGQLSRVRRRIVVIERHSCYTSRDNAWFCIRTMVIRSDRNLTRSQQSH